MNRTIAIVSVLVLIITTVLIGEEAERLDGFSPDSQRRQLEFEKRLKESLSTQRIEDHLRWLTSRPHRAGSEGARITAEYILKHLQEYGFQTEMKRYDAFLPAPLSVSIDLLEPAKESIPTTEDHIEADPFTEHVKEHFGWNGYSPSGDATGQVVYAHRGSEEDLRKLQSMGIDLRGKILLMRYFATGEGRKVRNAERFGAAGVILYSDPAEDGFRYGDVYPRGNWRPPGAIMRRSILDLPHEGDPFSPGWASTEGAKRLSAAEVELPGIPVLPISYRSAERILGLLDGPVAPYAWQGALGLTYKTGPGPAKVHIQTKMDNRDRPMWNVIGRLPGKTNANQWVILGNHHDAWIYGAGDPSSGTASLLELARVLGQLAREGFSPTRTLVIAFWDAEEMILGGSTEWVEDQAKELVEKAVACINMDSSVFNPDRPLSVSAHPALHNLFRAVSRHVPDPRTGKTTFEVWRDMQNQFRKVPGVDGWGEFFDPDQELSEPYIFESPYDDAAPFFNYLALPSSDMYYGADYGMYHSIYENFHWMKTVVDPTFEYHKVMSQIQGLAALRIANADLIPLDYANEALYWRRAYQDLAAVAKTRSQSVPQLQQALDLIDQWEKEARGLSADIGGLLNDPVRWKAVQPRHSELNLSLFQTARNFLRLSGFPGTPTQRNLFTASSYDFEGVSGSTLPGIRFNLDQGKLNEAEAESRLYLEALQRRVRTLQAIRLSLQ